MEKQQPSKAALLSIIPGLGQIYNKQKAKGFIFLSVTIVFVLYFLALATPELSNLITLGDKPGRDNSLFMLIRGAFHLIFVIVYVLFYFSNIKDAHTIAKRINNGIPVPRTLKDMIKGIYENGFPYLLIIPSYVAHDLRDYLPSYRNLDDRLYQLRLPTLATKQVVGLGWFDQLYKHLELEYLPFCLWFCSFLDYHLGFGSFYFTNRNWYLHSYHCQPTIYQRKTYLWCYFPSSLGCPSLHHYLDILKHV